MNIITYWTFDLFHIWHLKLLQRAKKLWDYLIVWVSTDEFNKQKGKKCIIPFKQRIEIVQNISCVDLVIWERNREQKTKDIEYFNAQLVMWDDWKGKFDEFNCIYLPRTPNISTTLLKQKLNGHNITA